ncbi:MAG: S8 family serine peptidase, partial [Rhodospirillaceae bacterium]|nr:S8 family serine peptidase [Rhodospirillaceae bacterium]
NVSLVGPPNRALETIVAGMVSRGFLVVAAVGNDGPAARPLYPASYPGVIGVTGVNAQGRALVEAARGPQVDFAAPGGDMIAADAATSFASVRGTSFAAPIVAGLLAQRLSAPNPENAAHAVRELAAQAEDLGARGRDDVYGAGLVGRTLRTPARGALAQR